MAHGLGGRAGGEHTELVFDRCLSTGEPEFFRSTELVCFLSIEWCFSIAMRLPCLPPCQRISVEATDQAPGQSDYLTAPCRG